MNSAIAYGLDTSLDIKIPTPLQFVPDGSGVNPECIVINITIVLRVGSITLTKEVLYQVCGSSTSNVSAAQVWHDLEISFNSTSRVKNDGT